MLCLHGTKPKGGPKPFKFELFWLDKPDLVQNMEAWWRECSTEGTSGFVIQAKINHLKAKLIPWTKENVGHLENRISQLEQLLAELMAKEEVLGLDVTETEEKKAMEKKLTEAVIDQSRFWSQRAKKL